MDQKQRTLEIHDEQAELFRQRYDEFVLDPYSSAFNYGRRKVEQVLDSFLPARGDGQNLLDAGCGAGYLLQEYARRGFHCTGLDGAAGMVERARSLNPGMEIQLGDVEAMPFGAEQFDCLVSIEVIRYLARPERCLREFHRVLRPGGLALVTAMPPLTLTGFPLANRLTARRQIGRFSRVRQFFHGVRCLERLFREAGFQSTEVRAAFWGPWRNVEPLLGGTMSRLLRRWEPLDDRLARVPGLRDFSNHLVVAARR